MATRKVDQKPKKRPAKGPKNADLWGVKSIHVDIDFDSWSKLRDFGVETNQSNGALIVEGLNLLLASKGADFRVERMTPERLALLKESGSVSVQAQGKLPLGATTNPVGAPASTPASE